MKIVAIQELFAENPISFSINGHEDTNTKATKCDKIEQIGENYVFHVHVGEKIVQFPFNAVMVTFASDAIVCDLCGKSQFDVEFIYRGKRCDVCSECGEKIALVSEEKRAEKKAGKNDKRD